MKICTKCGAHYSDNKMFCIDCNEKLSDKLSKSEEDNIYSNLNKRIDKLYKNSYPIRITEFDRAIGFLSLIGVVISIVFIVINLCTNRSINTYLYSLIFLLLSGVEALLPKLMWKIWRFRLFFIIKGADDAEPSEFYLAIRKIVIVFAAFIGITTLILTIF